MTNLERSRENGADRDRERKVENDLQGKPKIDRARMGLQKWVLKWER